MSEAWAVQTFDQGGGVSEASTCPCSRFPRRFGVVAWVAQNFLVAVVIAATVAERDDVVDRATDGGSSLALALLAQPAIPGTNALAVAHASRSTLALDNVWTLGRQHVHAADCWLQRRLELLELHVSAPFAG